VAASGVSAASEKLRKAILQLERDYPDNRERPLIASVKLSLGCLPETIREKIRPLGVFQDTASLSVISMRLEIEMEEAEELARRLVRFGLADMREGYLYFDPALCAILLSELGEEERETRASGGPTSWLSLCGPSTTSRSMIHSPRLEQRPSNYVIFSQRGRSFLGSEFFAVGAQRLQHQVAEAFSVLLIKIGQNLPAHAWVPEIPQMRCDAASAVVFVGFEECADVIGKLDQAVDVHYFYFWTASRCFNKASCCSVKSR
jgi:hypothetical protein